MDYTVQAYINGSPFKRSIALRDTVADLMGLLSRNGHSIDQIGFLDIKRDTEGLSEIKVTPTGSCDKKELEDLLWLIFVDNSGPFTISFDGKLSDIREKISGTFLSGVQKPRDGWVYEGVVGVRHL